MEGRRKMSGIIGIDLGTSTTEAAIYRNGKAEMILNLSGEAVTPSAVGVDDNGNWIVGDRARAQLLLSPENTAIEVKRKIGSGEMIRIGGASWTPAELSAHILEYVRSYASKYLGEDIRRAVISVPAYFNDIQRQETMAAGRRAGLTVERILNEPTAAALRYGLDHMEEESHVLVFDLGGGTFDVTLLEMFDGVLEVKASSGDNQLGGKDFDECICTWMIREFRQKTGIDPAGDPYAMVRMKEEAEACKEILSIQATGLAARMEHIGCQKAVIGISGGLDSTLALIVTTMAFDKLGLPHSGIIGITMPGLGTTVRTKSNAVDLMEALGVTSKEISVVPAVEQHFKDIGHDPTVMDSTYENAQARERTQILMDTANQENGLVVGTGDLSELALGWCTYNGDHMSMYGVNASVPKTLIKHLVRWAAENVFTSPSKSGGRSAAEILIDIVETPISPELMPADSKGEIKQKTEDLIGPYELHDFFIYNLMLHGYSPAKIFFLACRAFGAVPTEATRPPLASIYPDRARSAARQERCLSPRYDAETILKWLKKFYWRFFSQQFKRSCMPDGPKISPVSFSPRGDFRMPSDAKVQLWISELDKLTTAY